MLLRDEIRINSESHLKEHFLFEMECRSGVHIGGKSFQQLGDSVVGLVCIRRLDFGTIGVHPQSFCQNLPLLVLQAWQEFGQFAIIAGRVLFQIRHYLEMLNYGP